MPRSEQTLARALRERLESLGFRKRAGSIYTIDLGDPVLGWLGLNSATKYSRQGEVIVHPIVAVRHQDVARLVDELRGDRPHPYHGRGVFRPLYELVSPTEYRAWCITPEDFDAEADDLTRTVAEYGLPWMREHADLAQSRQALEAGLSHDVDYLLPALLAVSGDREAALNVLDQTVQQLGDRDDAYAHELRAFARAFRERRQFPVRTSHVPN